MSITTGQMKLRYGVCLASCALALAASLAFLRWTGRDLDQWIQDQLQHGAWHVAQSTNVELVKKLASGTQPTVSAEQERLHQHLVKILPWISHATRLRILAVKEGRPDWVLADSLALPPAGAPPQTAPPAPSGETADSLRHIQTHRSSSTILVQAPILDARTGRVISFVIVDFDRRAWSALKTQSMVTPAVFALVFTALGVILSVLYCLQQRGSSETFFTAPRRTSPILILLLGATVTIAGMHTLYRMEHRADRENFRAVVRTSIINITDSIHSLDEVRLESIRRFIEGSEQVTEEEFAWFTEFLHDDPSIFGWGWAGPATSDTNGKSSREYRVRYLSGSGLSKAGIGFVLNSVPELSTALETTLRTGLSTASDAILLPRPWPRQKIMLVFLPIHGPDPSHANHGVVFAALSWPDMVNRMADLMAPEHTTMHFRISEPQADENLVELAMFSGLTETGAAPPPLSLRSSLWHTRTLQAFGRTFLISAVSAEEGLWAGKHSGTRTAGVAGLLLTLMTAALIRTIENRGNMLRREVREQTLHLRKSEAFARSTLDGLSAKIAILGSDGEILAVNQAWRSFAEKGAGLLFSAKEGENFLRICDDALAVGHSEAGSIAKALRATIEGTPQPNGIECRLHTRHGDCWLEARVTPFPGADPARAILAYEDITARRKAEQSERKLSSGIEQSPNMVMITSTDGRIEYSNPRFTEIAGYRLEDIRGKDFHVVMADDIAREATLEIEQALAEGRMWEGEFQNRKADGTPFWHRVTISPLRDEDGRITHFMAVGEDITRQRDTESQLAQAQKMETVGRLAGGIAHDFNNLLQIILGSVEFALMDTPADSSIRGDLEEIKRAGEKSAALTRQLLTFARKQTIQPRVLDLNETISKLVTMLRRLIGDQIQLDFQPGDGVPPVYMDPMQIDQILVNLVVNARDAIRPPGKITLSTTPVELQAQELGNLHASLAGKFARIEVSDTGAGMDEETQARIFEPFFTTKANGLGTGLGLPTIYGIVEQNRGQIHVTSQLGKGTTFHIDIPATTKYLPPDEFDPATTSGDETILLVEDNPQVLKSVESMLRALGYTVWATTDPEEARRRAEDKAVALLLTDLVMPNINGRELAEAIRAHRPNLPCLFMSGYNAEIMGTDGVVVSNMFFIDKPFTQSALGHIVRKALDSNPPPSPPAPSSKPSSGPSHTGTGAA
ncbi:MAG: PAS domain S-box protein [Kiritimatiellae bacterium]|nr:PAS domain S-box protein [Kiritimatiellia bacterium]